MDREKTENHGFEFNEGGIGVERKMFERGGKHILD